MDIPMIERAKIQARILVPLVRTLQAELGETRANELVRKALGDWLRGLGETIWNRPGKHGLGEKMAASFDVAAAGDALDYEVLEKTADTFDVNVTGCRYAAFYRELGAPELGFLLVCSSDFAIAEGLGGEVELTRTQTIMQGASHCDFRYRLKHAAKE
jgi:hypothetical protein